MPQLSTFSGHEWEMPVKYHEACCMGPQRESTFADIGRASVVVLPTRYSNHCDMHFSHDCRLTDMQGLV
jgi:hypothetical protein